jgi:hypothetical protein
MRRWLILGLTALLPLPALGQEFRALQPIPTPRASDKAGGVHRFVPVDPKLIETAVRELFAAWNTPRMRELFGADYYEATRLIDTLATELPRDAVLRVLAIESMSTLNQTVQPGGPARPPALISTVSVIVRTQLEFNDPEDGFQRREGINEYVFEVKGAVPQ